jgi:transposase
VSGVSATRHASGSYGVTAGIYMGIRGPRILPARTGLQGYFVWKVDSEKLLPPKRFQVLPRQWVVESTFSWTNKNRRISKDYKKLPETSEAFV